MTDPPTLTNSSPVAGPPAGSHIFTPDNTPETAHQNTLYVALPPEKAALFLAAIVESSQDSIVTVDFGGIVTSWNRSAEQLYGYSAKEAIGQPLGALVLPHNLQEVLSNIDEIKHSHRVETFDSVRVNKDEHELILEVVMSPVKDEEGQVIGVSTMARDATQRKRAEEDLRESEAKLAIELADTQQLQSISSLLIEEENIDALYEQILESAIALMHSDAGSLQVLDSERNELRLLAWKGFHPEAAAFWEKVSTKTGSTCGGALHRGKRLIIADIKTSDFAAGSESRKYYELSGIAAVQSTPLVSRDGHIVGMVSTHWHAPHTPGERELKMLDVLARQTADLIDRRRSQEALRQSEARWRLLIEGAQEFAIFMLSLDNTILTWNSGAQRITGFTEEEAIGQSGAIIFTPEDRAANVPEQEKQTARRQGHANDERWHLRRTGERFWANGVMMAMCDEAGCVQGFVKIFRDATPQKLAEQELIASETRFRTLSDVVPQLIWTNTAQGEANYFNGRWYDYSGLSYEESYGLGWQVMVHPDDAPASVKNWHQSLARGEVFETEYRLRRADGTYGWHIGRNVPLLNSEGKVLGWFGSATDIDELKQAQEALRHAHDQLEERVQERTRELKHINQAREQLLERLVNVQEEERHRISRELHDVLGQELTALLMGLQLFPDNPEPTPVLPPGVPSYPQQVTKLRDAAKGLIEQVQRLAWEMRPAELDTLGLPAALNEYVEEWSAQYGIKAVFVHNFPEDTLSTTGPLEVALYRVTQEALTNVYRHAQATAVSVILDRDKTSLRAIVEDDGKGFDTDKDEHGQERTTAQRLGLLGMEERMELVGGTLTIESQPGKGTTVYARAPMPAPVPLIPLD